jgi:ABC-type oligopeptide transport system, periplasmic component
MFFHCLLIYCLCFFSAMSAVAASSHGITPFGELKYEAGFSHFEYVKPNAPKAAA